MILRGFAGGRGHGFQAGVVLEQGDGRLRHGVDVADLAEDAVFAVFNQLGHAAYAGGDGGHAAGHGFERGEAEGFHLRRHQHEIGEWQELVDVILLAEKVDAILDAELAREVLGGGALGGRRRSASGGRAGRGRRGRRPQPHHRRA